MSAAIMHAKNCAETIDYFKMTEAIKIGNKARWNTPYGIPQLLPCDQLKFKVTVDFAQVMFTT